MEVRSLSTFGPFRGSVIRGSVTFELQSFEVQSHSTFSLSTFGHSRFGHSRFSLSRFGLSRFGHSRFGPGFQETCVYFHGPPSAVIANMFFILFFQLQARKLLLFVVLQYYFGCAGGHISFVLFYTYSKQQGFGAHIAGSCLAPSGSFPSPGSIPGSSAPPSPLRTSIYLFRLYIVGLLYWAMDENRALVLFHRPIHPKPHYLHPLLAV